MFRYLVTALLITALIYALAHMNVLELASTVKNFLILFLIVFVVLNLLHFFFFNVESFAESPNSLRSFVEPVKVVGAANDAEALRQYGNNYLSRFKFYINSYISQHPDKNIWFALIKENHREVGRILANKAGTAGADRIVDAMTALDQSFNDVFSAMFSRNKSYVKTTTKRMNAASNQLVDALVEVLALPREQLVPLFEKRNQAILNMGQARVDQEWLADAQAYTEFQYHTLIFHNLLATRI